MKKDMLANDLKETVRSREEIRIRALDSREALSRNCSEISRADLLSETILSRHRSRSVIQIPSAISIQNLS